MSESVAVSSRQGVVVMGEMLRAACCVLYAVCCMLRAMEGNASCLVSLMTKSRLGLAGRDSGSSWRSLVPTITSARPTPFSVQGLAGWRAGGLAGWQGLGDE